MVKDPDVEDGARVVVEATIRSLATEATLSFKGSKIAMDQEGVVQAIANRITPWWNRPCPLLPTYSLSA